MAGLLDKIRIKAPHRLCLLNAPAAFEKNFGKLPIGVTISHELKNAFDSLHWFVKNKAEVDKQAPRILKLLQPGVQVWCYYPKVSSKMQTDLTRDKGWDSLMQDKNMKWISLISVDLIWSAFGFRLMNDKEKKNADKPVLEREIFKYADPVTKTIKLPEDIRSALLKNRKAAVYFDGLSFSNRREYVEWVITSKREETRLARISGMMEKLKSGRKNPTEK